MRTKAIASVTVCTCKPRTVVILRTPVPYPGPGHLDASRYVPSTASMIRLAEAVNGRAKSNSDDLLRVYSDGWTYYPSNTPRRRLP